MSFRLVGKSIWCNPGNRGKRLKKAFDAVRWQVYKRTIKSPRVLKLPNNVLFRAYPDCVVSSALVYADWPEYHELRFLRSQLSFKEIVLDVGANVGHISMLLADIVGPDNIFAFEPTPISFRRLVENWQLNGWATGNLSRLAVGATSGSKYVQDVNRPLTTNSVAETPVDDRFVEVPLVRLDDVNHLWSGCTIGLIKIDVEGYETEVFRGSCRLLEMDRPRIIMFESLSGSLDPEISFILDKYGYVVFQLDSLGRPDFSRSAAQNLFAVPEERRKHFER